MTTIRPLLEAKDRKLIRGGCYFCGADPKPPDQLVPMSRHHMSNMIVLVLRTTCCHAQTNTEPWGAVLDYLCDGWARAELVCRLYNQSVGAPVEPSVDRPAVFSRPERARYG